jgi:hypothetical protein
MRSFAAKLGSALLFCLVSCLLVLSACVIPTDAGTTGGTRTSSGARCSTGYCLNNGQCCPRASPDYTYGGHGYQAGCYRSCPYVGDCGSTTQCF